MVVLTEEAASRWLDAYGASWVDRDPGKAAALFHEDVVYRERRFTQPLVGRNAIRNYWANRVADFQEDVTYVSQIWAVRDNLCFASFQASFTWTPINGRIEIDGVFRLAFSSVSDGMPVCDRFEEWFDLNEI